MENNGSPRFFEATYTEQRVPMFRGNPLIEALPPTETHEQVLESLFRIPDFSVEQRHWHDAERIQLIAQLSSFMVPLERHVQLSYALDALMRHGYVNRIPRSVTSTELFRKLYEQKMQGKTFQSAGTVTAQLSASLVGMSGTGKTTTIKRLLSRFPEVIHHPLFGVYQIPYLHIEMPYDGASVKGLAQSIFRKVDLLLPEADYYGQYCRGSAGAETLMNHAARVLHMHSVGLLVVDETQNLENSPKNRQALMTLLVSASNELGVPVLFVGTNRAKRLLSLSFRQARRSVGHAVPAWDRLSKGSLEQPGEWEDFVKILFHFQWIRNPAELNPFITDVLYEYSQGIIDVAIKLFATCQVRAIMNESEAMTGALIADVAHRELGMLAPMIDALRRNDELLLEQYDDIGPQNLDDVLRDVQLRYSGGKVSGASVGPDSVKFEPMVATSLASLGYDADTAVSLAKSATTSGATNVLDGVQKALSTASSGKKTSGKANKPSIATSYVPGDYRSAFPCSEGVTVLQNMQKLGMLPDLEKLFPG